MDITTLGGYTAHLCVCGILGKAPQIRPKTLSFEKIYNFAKSHLVECIAYYGVELLDEKPDFWEKWTKHVSQMSAVDSIQQIEFERICTEFENEKIYYIPLKGFAVKNCYPHGDMRRMSDLDIYVGSKQYEADSVMKNLGYECESFGKSHHNKYILKPAMNVEIHSRLTSDEKYRDYFDEICKAAIADAKQYNASFNTIEAAKHIVYHTYKHFSRGGCGIRNVLDMYLYTQKHKTELESEKFKSELESIGLYKFYSSFLSLARVWFENAEESPLDKQLAEYIYSSGAYGKESRNIQNTVVKKMDKPKITRKAKLKGAFSVMFPEVEYMKLLFPYVKKCILLLPAAYVHRAFRAVFVSKKLYKLADVANVSSEQASKTKMMFDSLGI